MDVFIRPNQCYGLGNCQSQAGAMWSEVGRWTCHGCIGVIDRVVNDGRLGYVYLRRDRCETKLSYTGRLIEHLTSIIG
jgi:hypothetical protein